MSTMQSIATIGIVILGTMITRFLPFIIFPEGKTPPSFIKYLGTVLPYAVVGLLVVYSIKDGIFTSTHGLPEFIAIFFVIILHKWKKHVYKYGWWNYYLYDISAKMLWIRSDIK
ncbi:AzlD domain-containing protein [uncultured Clostridium sp.]|uniref:branched-chain amino acid transporter permease n=1 Tax=uncultured Clostridium sp. TaxID=59620 RepID=UPI003459535F